MGEFLGLRRCGARGFYGARPATPRSTNGGPPNGRLDEERRKLDQAQREFAEYVDAIRRAKDREEFDRFMAERRTRPAGGGSNRTERAVLLTRSARAKSPLSPDGGGGTCA